MSNQTSTSQKQNYSRTRALYREGKWPPAGHPWRELFLLAPEVVEDLFRNPAWEALLVGLRRWQASSIETGMTAAGLSDRDEARGVYNTVNELLSLQEDIRLFHQIVREPEEPK